MSPWGLFGAAKGEAWRTALHRGQGKGRQWHVGQERVLVQHWSPLSYQTPRCAHLLRKVNPKSPLQKQFCSHKNEFMPRFNQTKERKTFFAALSRKHKELQNMGHACQRATGSQSPLQGLSSLQTWS